MIVEVLIVSEKDYPSHYWRGIANKDFICDYRLNAAAFQFDEEVREDGFKELSINWNDSDEALTTVLNQKKENGKLQFSVGAAKLELSKTKQFLSAYIEREEFNYERRPIEGNEFHGNLLVKASIDKRTRALVSHTLALIADTNITYQDNSKD